MNILLDTCTFLWIASDPVQLSRRAKNEYLDENNTLFLSSITMWELIIKWRKKKLTCPLPPEQFFRISLERYKLIPLSFSPFAAVELAALKHHHKDPHDHMLICQALAHNLTIMTPDEQIQKYDVQTVW